MLKVSSVSKSYGATQALQEVSFEAPEGSVLGIIGENGSGKSTLMRLIANEEIPDSGSVDLNGNRVYLAHQELSLCPQLTVYENIFLGVHRGVFVRSREMQENAGRILAEMGFSHINVTSKVLSLPVADRQIVQIARSIARDAKIILLDEPTSSLNQDEKLKLYGLIKSLKAKGKLILFISHFLDEIRAVVDQIVILRDGQKVAEGSVSQFNDDEIVAHMVGRTVSEYFPKTQREIGDVVISIENLTNPTVESLEIRRGEIVGVAGLNGAGRTELLRSIMALRPVQNGKISVKGFPSPATRPLWRKGIGFVSEERKIDGLAVNLSIADNIQMSNQRGWLNDPRRNADHSEPWIESLGTKCKSPNQKVRELSGGNQQKVAFARLLEAKCDVFLLDEPTRGVDIGAKSTLYAQLDLAASRGCAVLMTSSYLPELFGICDRIAVMNRGKLVSIQSVNETSPEEIMKECVA